MNPERIYNIISSSETHYEIFFTLCVNSVKNIPTKVSELIKRTGASYSANYNLIKRMEDEKFILVKKTFTPIGGDGPLEVMLAKESENTLKKFKNSLFRKKDANFLFDIGFK